MNLLLETQYEIPGSGLPSDADFHTWAKAALGTRRDASELVIRIVDEAEMTTLNQTYRKKTEPTNVLSFPLQGPGQVATNLLGDLVICAPVVQQEAIAQGKTEWSHWAHMTVHGVLHLLGFDHQNAQNAETMENLERDILAQLGISDPYQMPARS